MTSTSLWTPTRQTRFEARHLAVSRGGPAAAYLPEHSHPELQVSVRFRSKAGGDAQPQVSLYAPHQPHSAAWSMGSEVLVLLLRKPLLDRAADELGIRGRFEIIPLNTGRDGLLEAMGRTLLDGFPAEPDAGDLFFESMATFLAGYILRKHSDRPAHSTSLNRLSVEQMQRVRHFIQERIECGFDVRELARSAGLPPQQFAHRLRLTTGLSPWAYVQRHRISIACRLLRDQGLSLAELAHRLGFASQSHFTNAFRSVMRTTPGAYRRQV